MVCDERVRQRAIAQVFDSAILDASTMTGVVNLRKAIHCLSITTMTMLSTPVVLAMDAACSPLIEASEAKVAQSAWHAVSQIDDFRSEVIKAEGKFYMFLNDQWIVAPMNMDEVERETIASMQSGKIKVTGCQTAGTEIIDGVETSVLIYTVELPGSGIPAAQTRINLGVADKLPYKQGSAAGETKQSTTYRYIGVKPPM